VNARQPALENQKSAQNGILEIDEGSNRSKIHQKWTKIHQNWAKGTPKTSEIEEDCENEHAAVMNHPRYRRYDHDDEAIQTEREPRTWTKGRCRPSARIINQDL
jgi:hypothetical protein